MGGHVERSAMIGGESAKVTGAVRLMSTAVYTCMTQAILERSTASRGSNSLHPYSIG
jgi:hypothetical protein